MAERFSALLLSVAVGLAPQSVADSLVVGEFSAMSIGTAFTDGWRVLDLPRVNSTRFSVVDVGGTPVVRADAVASAGSLTRIVTWDTSVYPHLEWRWRVNNVLNNADIGVKDGDDYPARLYVLFDYPPDRLSLLDQAKLTLARWLYGEHIPAAALCYVWDNRAPQGSSVWNAYTERVRMIVLRNADNEVGAWVTERRDLVADFQAAFKEAPPRVSGLSIATDTDQTGESATAWFGDIFASE